MIFPWYPLSLYLRDNISKMPDFTLKTNAKNGLCNQLFSLINGIIRCATQKKSYCIIDSFTCCIEQGNITNIGKIIDLTQTTINLNKIYGLQNIKLYDRSNFNIRLISAEYGVLENKTIDVKYYLENPINSNDMNFLFNCDPCPGINKKLYTYYSINNSLFEGIFEENCDRFCYLFDKNYLANDLFINKRDDFCWYNVFNEQLFLVIMKSINFNDGFYQIVDDIEKHFNINEKLNMVHLRLENDAIRHWAVINKVSPDEFKTLLSKKYLSSIRSHIAANEKIYILSADENETINQISSECPRNYIYTDISSKNNYLMKYIGVIGRELCAIIDLIIGIHHAKLFIGCHNMLLARGSSFSYVIARNVTGKKILLDLDNIFNDEQIYT